MTDPHGADSAEIERLRQAADEINRAVVLCAATCSGMGADKLAEALLAASKAMEAPLAALRTPPDDAVKLREANMDKAARELKNKGVEGFGASFNRGKDAWSFYTMPGIKPFPLTLESWEHIDFVIDALRAALKGTAND